MKRGMLLIALTGVLIGCPDESNQDDVSVNPMPKGEMTRLQLQLQANEQKPQRKATKPKTQPKPGGHVSTSEVPDSESDSKMDTLAKWLLSVQGRKGWETERKADNFDAQIRGLYLTDNTMYLAIPAHFTTTHEQGRASKVTLLQFNGDAPLEMQRTLIGKSEGFEVWNVERPEALRRFRFTFKIGQSTEGC